MTVVGRFFTGHPERLGGVLVLLAALSVVVWYLASPLFVRTYREEALPVPATAAAPATGAQTSGSPAATPMALRVLAMGELGYVDALHNGRGPVQLVEVAGQRFVRFENVAISNAPDIHVYLSKEAGGKWAEATSLYLGPLKATNGSFNYELGAATEVSSYRSVVVWCRAFSVLITWADLS